MISTTTLRRPVAIAAMFLATTSHSTTPRQIDGAAESGQMVAIALRLMERAYPDLRESAGRVQINGTFYGRRRLREFVVQYADPQRGHATEAATALCQGGFEFSYSRPMIFYYRARGECALEKRNAALEAMVRANLRWSDRQIAEYLIAQRAEFPPAAVEAMQEHIRAVFDAQDAASEAWKRPSVEFQMPERLDDGTMDARSVDVSLKWKATFLHPSDPYARLTAIFEPLAGRLVHVMNPGEN